MDVNTRHQLELQIASIERDCPAPRAETAAHQADDIDYVALGDEYEPAEPFGRWLLQQRDRGDWIDDLAAAARADRAFPKDGDPETVGRRMQILGADGDAFEQLEDAERCWRSM